VLKSYQLLFLDRNAAVADTDFDAFGVMLFLVELVTQNHGGECKHANDEGKSIAIHDLATSICMKNRGSDIAAPDRNTYTSIERLAPAAAAIAVLVDPAVAMAAPDQVRTANHAADHTADDRAGRSGNDRTGAGADRNAFQRSGLGHHGHHGERQYDKSSLEHYAHGESPWVTSIELSGYWVRANRLFAIASISKVNVSQAGKVPRYRCVVMQ
jgi:hypothetical protein